MNLTQTVQHQSTKAGRRPGPGGGRRAASGVIMDRHRLVKQKLWRVIQGHFCFADEEHFRLGGSVEELTGIVRWLFLGQHLDGGSLCINELYELRAGGAHVARHQFGVSESAAPTLIWNDRLNRHWYGELLALLLELGADPNVADDDGNYALTAVLLNTHIDSADRLRFAKMLLDAGARVSNSGRWGGHSVLHLAARSNDGEMVQLLLQRGGDPLARTDIGRTALFQACEKVCLGPVQPLLEGGADPNSIDKFGMTPLMCLAAHDTSVEPPPEMNQIAQLLLDRGADLQLEDFSGFTAERTAMHFHNVLLMQLLRAEALRRAK
jgi:hypothetical protein